MSVGEANAHIRKSSDIWSVNRRFPIETLRARIQIIDSDEEHIRASVVPKPRAIANEKNKPIRICFANRE